FLCFMTNSREETRIPRESRLFISKQEQPPNCGPAPPAARSRPGQQGIRVSSPRRRARRSCPFVILIERRRFHLLIIVRPGPRPIDHEERAFLSEPEECNQRLHQIDESDAATTC